MKKILSVKSDTNFSRGAIKVLKTNCINDSSWSSLKLFIIQNYTDNVNGDVPLKPQQQLWVILQGVSSLKV